MKTISLNKDEVYRILYPGSVEGRSRRFTQDTPILPDVWILFGEDLKKSRALLLTPHRNCTSAEVAKSLAIRLRGDKENAGRKVMVSFNDSHVLANLTFRQTIRAALPLSWWWTRDLKNLQVSPTTLEPLIRHPAIVDLLMEPAHQDEHGEFPENVLNLIRIAGSIAQGIPMPEDQAKLKDYLVNSVREVQKLVDGLKIYKNQTPTVWSIFSNRIATAALSESRQTVKADASIRLFDINSENLSFAVVDSGVDAAHVAFRVNKVPEKKSARAAPKKEVKDGPLKSRVQKTMDFTRLKELMSVNVMNEDEDPEPDDGVEIDPDVKQRVRTDIRQRLKNGRPLDWGVLEEALEISHSSRKQYCDKYRPENEHGTHVAGIIGANWAENKDASGNPEPLVGVCPDINLYDLRVIGKDGTGDEFCILAALQYVRYLNQSKGRRVIHGVNISISIPHQASSFACGQTPVCDEVNRMVSSGVVVVVAAGNGGYGGAGLAAAGDYRDISITDPGNSDLAITVGATHRSLPHRYGVSYFSSRGPTGDGRMKPDLVAPGEQIRSTIPGDDSVTLDGTSMAAPHVSGAAAILMARHKELIGDPQRIKDILLRTATDLGRVRGFQGAGLLDILRALQSI